jgi:hypothetical protein
MQSEALGADHNREETKASSVEGSLPFQTPVHRYLYDQRPDRKDTGSDKLTGADRPETRTIDMRTQFAADGTPQTQQTKKPAADRGTKASSRPADLDKRYKYSRKERRWIVDEESDPMTAASGERAEALDSSMSKDSALRSGEARPPTYGGRREVDFGPLSKVGLQTESVCDRYTFLGSIRSRSLVVCAHTQGQALPRTDGKRQAEEDKAVMEERSSQKQEYSRPRGKDTQSGGAKAAQSAKAAGVGKSATPLEGHEAMQRMRLSGEDLYTPNEFRTDEVQRGATGVGKGAQRQTRIDKAQSGDSEAYNPLESQGLTVRCPAHPTWVRQARLTLRLVRAA